MHSIQGNLRKNGEFINNQGGALLHHNSPIPWSTFAQYLTPYWWNGREWQNVDTALLRRYVGKVMAGDSTVKVSKSRIDSTMSVMLDQTQRLNCINPASNLVFFRNGSFNPETAILSPHDPANFNNRTLSVDYDPVAVAPTWQNWLADIFKTNMSG
ncbi:MAG: hypothetical protein ACH344_11380, partial [Yersinia sp. (in: enterobacteria)]